MLPIPPDAPRHVSRPGDPIVSGPQPRAKRAADLLKAPGLVFKTVASVGIVSIVLLLTSTTPVLAQVATQSSSLEWDQNDTDAPLMEYFLSVDNSVPSLVANVMCTSGVLPAHVCVGDLPALTVGAHVLELIARRTVDGVAFDSLPSTALSITFAALPSSPQGLRLR